MFCLEILAAVLLNDCLLETTFQRQIHEIASPNSFSKKYKSVAIFKSALLAGPLFQRQDSSIMTRFKDFRTVRTQLWRSCETAQNDIIVCCVFVRAGLRYFCLRAWALLRHGCTVYKTLDTAIAVMCVGDTKYSLIK